MNSDRFSLIHASFYVHRAICIDASRAMHVLEFSRMFSALSNEPNSIVLANWRGLPRKQADTSKRIQIQTVTTFSPLPPWPISDKVGVGESHLIL